MPPSAIVRRVRVLLLIGVVLLLAALYGLYRFGQAGRTPPSEGAAPAQQLGDSGLGEVRMASSKFEYALTDAEGNTIFLLRGDSSQSDPNQQTFIRGMAVRLYSEQETYTVQSAEAIFNPETEDVTLLGGVTLSSDSGLQVTTRSLQLRQKGRLLLGDEPLQFQYGEVAEGEARQFRGHLEEGLYVLTGDVWIQNLPGAGRVFSLKAERALFDRRQHHLRADGGVRMRTATGGLQAQRVSLFLDDAEQYPKFLRALWGVVGRLKATPAGGHPASTPAGNAGSLDADSLSDSLGDQVDFQGRSLSATFEPGSSDLSKFELEGSANKRAHVITERRTGDGPARLNFSARYLAGALENGRIAGVDAWSDVHLIESAPARPAQELRRVTSRRAQAFFGPDGGLERAVFQDEVLFDDPAVHASADRATFALPGGTVELFGAPVELRSDRGDLAGERVTYTRRDGLLHARGGTRTQLAERDGGLLAASPLGAGDGPIWVEAEEAFLRGAPRGFLFRGGVRAWRGEDLILADSLLGQEEQQSLLAEGNVRTLGRAVSTGTAPGGVSGAGSGAGDATARAPVEVTADSMSYEDSAKGDGGSTVVYRGSVRAVQAARTMECATLTLELAGGGSSGAKSLLCEGAVRIQDPPSGATITGGERALYVIGAQTIDVSGDPVRLKDREGRVVTGLRMVYDLTSGTFRTGAGDRLGAATSPPPPATPPESR